MANAQAAAIGGCMTIRLFVLVAAPLRLIGLPPMATDGSPRTRAPALR
jgi:hypothetical protein